VLPDPLANVVWESAAELIKIPRHDEAVAANVMPVYDRERFGFEFCGFLWKICYLNALVFEPGGIALHGDKPHGRE
jgi:hypothetical protein